MAKYLIMVSHGDFAPGLHSAVKMMTGDRPDVLSTSLKDGMGADEFQENFRNLVKDFTEEDEVILLADIQGGSPFTKANEVLGETGLISRSLIITGMNMPLAVTAVLMKDNMDLPMLKEVILSEGHTGLSCFEVTVDDEDDDDL